jgi:hypothetical protein
MGHVWGDSLVSGWGPFEFVDMANAVGIVPILTFAYDTNKAADWADLVEYLWADKTHPWGSVCADWCVESLASPGTRWYIVFLRLDPHIVGIGMN